MIFCWFGHDTYLVTEGEEGQIRCKRCPAVLDRWPLLRPEQQIAIDRVIQDRERRAAQMAMPSVRSSKLLRMPR